MVFGHRQWALHSVSFSGDLSLRLLIRQLRSCRLIALRADRSPPALDAPPAWAYVGHEQVANGGATAVEVGRRTFLRLATGGSVVSLLSVSTTDEVNAASRWMGPASQPGRTERAQAAPDDPGLPDGAFGQNVEVVGYSDLAGRPGFKLDIQQVQDRWYLYMGHLWHRGWTIADVTDPANPEVLNFIPGPTNTWTIQMVTADGKMVTALERIAPGWGGDANAPNDEGVLIWDLSDPLEPQRLGQFRTGGSGTHRNFYAGGQYAHLTAGMPGYSGNIYVIIDIADPAQPVEVSRWWVPGQHAAAGESTDPAVSLHGPPYVIGNLVYLPYGAAGMQILDISDISQPKRVGQLGFSPPFLKNIGVHSILPLPERGIATVNSESIAEDCQEALNHASVVDISNPAEPVLLATMPKPAPPAGSPWADFCEKGGRFGPHNVHMQYANPFVEHRDDRIYLTYFTAGLRVIDIADPRQPLEVGYFLPPEPTERIGVLPRTLTSQTEDVLVDARGYIYITDKNEGLWILRSVEA
jgi:hypothetical protein